MIRQKVGLYRCVQSSMQRPQTTNKLGAHFTSTKNYPTNQYWNGIITNGICNNNAVCCMQSFRQNDPNLRRTVTPKTKGLAKTFRCGPFYSMFGENFRNCAAILQAHEPRKLFKWMKVTRFFSLRKYKAEREGFAITLASFYENSQQIVPTTERGKLMQIRRITDCSSKDTYWQAGGRLLGAKYTLDVILELEILAWPTAWLWYAKLTEQDLTNFRESNLRIS